MVEQANTMISSLGNFCELSGQRINHQKSSLLFSNNTSDEVQQSISNVFRVPVVTDMGKYLGIPSIHRRLKNESFDGILDRIQSRLSRWRAQTLSVVGRQVLAQSVLSSIPYYTMQSTLVLVGVCSAIERIIRNFIWGSSNERRKCYLINWETVTR